MAEYPFDLVVVDGLTLDDVDDVLRAASRAADKVFDSRTDDAGFDYEPKVRCLCPDCVEEKKRADAEVLLGDEVAFLREEVESLRLELDEAHAWADQKLAEIAEKDAVIVRLTTEIVLGALEYGE